MQKEKRRFALGIAWPSFSTEAGCASLLIPKEARLTYSQPFLPPLRFSPVLQTSAILSCSHISPRAAYRSQKRLR